MGNVWRNSTTLVAQEKAPIAMRIRLILFAGIVLAGISSQTRLAHAEGVGGLVVSPPFQEITLSQTPGDQPLSISLTNRTAVEQTLVLSAVDFKSLDESGGVAFVGLNGGELLPKYGLATWLRLDSPSVILPAGGSTKVGAVIQNQAAIAPGGHYGAVLFRVENQPHAKEANPVALTQVFASLIFVKKLGGERYGLKLGDVGLPRDWTGKPLVKLRFHNGGNVHVVPRGTVWLESKNGTQVLRGIINEDSARLLPESYRTYSTLLSRFGPVAPGSYRLVVHYRHEGSDTVQSYSRQVRIGGDPTVFLWIGLITLVCLGAFGLAWRVSRRNVVRG